MAIATDYRYMKNTGKTPRFEEAFAFKHILNAVDGALFLNNAIPLNRHSVRLAAGLIPNTDHAYTQAMNRFNTTGVTTTFETVLEAANDPPMPIWRDDPRSGTRTYHLPVMRGWKFTRKDNGMNGPNYTKYEAVLTAQFGTPREAKMSCTTPGVVNHWDQAQNQTWFG